MWATKLVELADHHGASPMEISSRKQQRGEPTSARADGKHLLLRRPKGAGELSAPSFSRGKRV